ncbi:DUF58 domain-containing protein [Haloarculaceae archaeon H-GB1-1]|nr:DUF58 domain-containing protein [Haloarculaceae archaeon H-GB1-1]
MRPTRRGYATGGVVVLAMAMASLFGARALNAVVAPAVVGLVVGLVQVWRTDPPSVERSTLDPGFPGESRTVELSVDGADGSTATVIDAVPEGFEARASPESSLPTRTTRRLDESAGSRAFAGSPQVTLVHAVDATLPATVRYEVEFDRRGEHRLGPVTVRVRDALGLFERTFDSDRAERILVYPRVRRLTTDAAQLVQAAGGSHAVESGGFARIREYVRGDPMRKIHWKSSARRPGQLFVTELDTELDGSGDVSIALHGTARVDGLASAAASLATVALDAGYRVELVVPETEVASGSGQSHRSRLLSTLARTDGGEISGSARDRADVEVRPGSGGVAVVVHGEEFDFETLCRSGARDDGAPDGPRQRAGGAA